MWVTDYGDVSDTYRGYYFIKIYYFIDIGYVFFFFIESGQSCKGEIIKPILQMRKLRWGLKEQTLGWWGAPPIWKPELLASKACVLFTTFRNHSASCY